MGGAAPVAGEDRPAYEGWRVALASGAGVFVGFGSLLVYTFGVFLKPVAAELGWSREEVSAAFGIAASCLAVSSPLLGLLLDRVRPRAVIAPCVAVFGVAFASLALLTPHLWHLYAVFLVMGVVGNGTAQMGYSRAVSSWFLRRRGQALALVMAGSAVGAIVLPPLAQALVRTAGWRGAFAALGALVLLLGLPMAAVFVRERPVPAAQKDAPVEGASIREALASRGFWILVTILFFSSIAQNGVITHIAALLTDRAVSAQGGAMALSAMGAASLAGRLLGGFLLDRFFAGRVSCALLAAAALGTFLLAGAQSLGTGLVAAALIGFGMGGEADVTPYLIARYYGLRHFGALYGMTWTFYAFAGALGPVLMGKAFDASGSYESLLVRLSLGIAAMAALSLLLPRYGARPAAAGLPEAVRAPA
ncbi:MAG: MFS transporter [Vicinamibacteria bacterium]